MNGPVKTVFNSDECQCLLDIFDRIIADNILRQFGRVMDMFLTTEEEISVYKKLVRAGEFYVPEL